MKAPRAPHQTTGENVQSRKVRPLPPLRYILCHDHCPNTITAAQTGQMTKSWMILRTIPSHPRLSPRTRTVPRQSSAIDSTRMVRRSRRLVESGSLHIKKLSIHALLNGSNGQNLVSQRRMELARLQIRQVWERTSYSDQARIGGGMRRRRRLRLEA